MSLPAAVETFLTEAHLATRTTIRPDGTPHVTPVRCTWDNAARLARITTVATSHKVSNLVASPQHRAALCQAAGFRWVTLQGTALESDNHERVSEGVWRYTRRYRSRPAAGSEVFPGEAWCPRQDSNLRPSDSKITLGGSPGHWPNCVLAGPTSPVRSGERGPSLAL
ncbi:pyridoxamine 5'-phosphate oxidase family protein [Pseudonocardia sp. Cha107L01]|uniref:pyridoxamine 5'-phosphate oxidase family protein n=1 Tax=Pseudonocardia sp. Cha107L01 TaxID=3457576 RepID=UPI00403E7D2E